MNKPLIEEKINTFIDELLELVGVQSKDEPYEAYFPINLNNGKLRITLPFASISYPYNSGNPHKGLDYAPFAGSEGQAIFSLLNGRVYKSVMQNTGLGNYVVVESKSPIDCELSSLKGRSVTIEKGSVVYNLYAHMSKVAVKSGDTVKAGSRIGSIGNTGYSKGPHVHHELRIDDYDKRVVVDPLEYIGELLNKTGSDWYFET